MATVLELHAALRRHPPVRCAELCQRLGGIDMHDGNLTFLPGLELAPVYDMLPMRYAPLRGGELAVFEFAPPRPLPTDVALWRKAAHAAAAFWGRCGTDARIGGPFRDIAAANRRSLLEILN